LSSAVRTISKKMEVQTEDGCVLVSLVVKL